MARIVRAIFLKRIMMSNYCQITIPVTSAALREILVAQLSDAGFEGFEESENTLLAYAPEENYPEEELNSLMRFHDLTFSKSLIQKQNWNELWESNFEPVRVGEFVGIRASFHPPFEGVAHEIVITPKMSFGTGHHATTSQVMELMQELNFNQKSVFDFGTGTGILAILAEQLGASSILAVDHDEWCIENATENVLVNHCTKIKIQQANNASTGQRFDIVLANINKNIILDNLKHLQQAVGKGAQVLLSGLLETDESEMIEACRLIGWTQHKTLRKNGWIAIWLQV